MAKELTEEQLRKKLEDINKRKEENENEERNARAVAAYKRCKDAEYILEKGEYPHWFTYRKVSNIRPADIKDWGERKVFVLDKHEEIRIHLRSDKNNTVYSGLHDRLDSGVTFEDHKKIGRDSCFLRDNDHPISKEEYEMVKEFALSQLKALRMFFKKS